MTDTKNFDTIIIGAGISGISLAQRLTAASVKNCVFEANKVGGCIDSQQYEDFWFEMGAHTIYNSYNKTIEYIHSNSLGKDIQPRKSYHSYLFNQTIKFKVFL